MAGNAVPASVAPSSFSSGDLAAGNAANAGLPSSVAGAPSGLTAGAGGSLTTPSALTPNLSSSALAGTPSSLSAEPGAGLSLAGPNGSTIPLSGGTSSLTSGAAGGAGTGSLAAPAASAATPAASSAGTGAASAGGLGLNLGTLKSVAPLAASGIGLLMSAKEGNKTPANYNALEAQAANLQNQGNQLQGYLTSGTLPPGVQAGLDQAKQSAEATIKSQYASRGMSGSSAESQDLANLNATVVAQGAQIATGLLQQGVSESEFSSQMYQQLMQTSIQQDNQLSASIANFAGALGGMGLKALPG